MMELCKRVQNCEDTMTKKEKDLLFLKVKLHEIRKRFNEKEKEVDLLKVKNMELQNEMKLTKELNEEMKDQFEKELKTS